MNGVNYYGKIVIVTGAGFSAPAKIPIQNGIIQELISKPQHNIMEKDPDEFNTKFLTSYIEVGLYLLDEYFGVNVEQDIISYKNICKNLKSDISKDDYDYCVSFLFQLKEKIRVMIATQYFSNRRISLEDVFTSLDKTINKKTHNKNYTYIELDKLRHAILRLFVYYFEKCIRKYDFSSAEYLPLIEYVKRNKGKISFITTNWDTIFEAYMQKNDISFDLCLSGKYYKYDNSEIKRRKNIPYIKIHGSLNWYRCLNCDTILVLQKEESKRFLFDDNAPEECIYCKAKPKNDFFQLEPEIVTPTMIKSITSQLYCNLWKSAADELSLADKVIFIGYSLPIADYEFRYMLKRTIKKKAQIDVILIQKDNPSTVAKKNDYLKQLLPQTRYEELFGTNRITFFYDGFKPYFDSLTTQT